MKKGAAHNDDDFKVKKSFGSQSQDKSTFHHVDIYYKNIHCKEGWFFWIQIKKIRSILCWIWEKEWKLDFYGITYGIQVDRNMELGWLWQSWYSINKVNFTLFQTRGDEKKKKIKIREVEMYKKVRKKRRELYFLLKLVLFAKNSKKKILVSGERNEMKRDDEDITHWSDKIIKGYAIFLRPLK